MNEVGEGEEATEEPEEEWPEEGEAEEEWAEESAPGIIRAESSCCFMTNKAFEITW